MGTIKTTNIEPIADNGTVTLGSSGDTITVPSGVTVNMSSATQTGVGGTMTPVFSVALSNSISMSSSTDVLCVFDTEEYDTGGVYNTSTGRFTPTTAGKYFLTAQVGNTINSTDSAINQLKTAIRQYNSSDSNIHKAIHKTNPAFVNRPVGNPNKIFDMAVGDYATVTQFINGSGYSINGDVASTYFQGFKIIE
jgi:hypothetical protein